MADITHYVASRGLERAVPGAASTLRAVPLPRLEGPPEVSLGAGLGAIGEGAAKLTQALAERDAVLGRASDLVTMHKSLNTYEEGLNAFHQQMLADQRIPPLEYRQRLAAYRDEQLQALAPQIPQRVRGPFEAEVGRTTLPLLRQAEAHGQQRFLKDADLSYTSSLDRLGRVYQQQTDPREREQTLGVMDQLADSYVQQGIYGATQGEELKRRARDTLALAQEQDAVRRDPVVKLQQYMQGPAHPDNAHIPVDVLPKLIDEGKRQVHALAEERDSKERYVQTRITDLQNQNADAIRSRLVTLEPRPENMAAIDALQQEIIKARTDQKISHTNFDSLSSLAREMRLAARKPPERYDNPQIEQQMRLQVLNAQTPKDFDDAHASLQKVAGELSPATWKELASSLETRRDRNHYSKTPEYQDGLKIIMQGAFPEGGIIFPQLLKEDMQFRLRHTLDAYEARMNELARTDPAQMRREARDTALALRQQYLDVATTAASQLPRVFLDPQGHVRQDTAQVIEELNLQVQRGQISAQTAREWFQTYERFKAARPPVAAAPAAGTVVGPATPTTPATPPAGPRPTRGR